MTSGWVPERSRMISTTGGGLLVILGFICLLLTLWNCLTLWKGIVHLFLTSKIFFLYRGKMLAFTIFLYFINCRLSSLWKRGKPYIYFYRLFYNIIYWNRKFLEHILGSSLTNRSLQQLQAEIGPNKILSNCFSGVIINLIILNMVGTKYFKLRSMSEILDIMDFRVQAEKTGHCTYDWWIRINPGWWLPEWMAGLYQGQLGSHPSLPHATHRSL